MLNRLTDLLTRWCTRWIPDAWVIAVLLTGVTFLLAFFCTPSSAYELVQFWGNGFWLLLSFAMQMCLVIVTGYIVATSPLVSRVLRGLASLPKGPKGSIALMAVVSMGLAWFNWGLSIVASAMMTRFITERQKGVDYRLLVATGYLGMGVIWHAGLSASTPLLVATPKHFLESEIGIIPITETIFHPFNLLLAVVVFIAMLLLAVLLHPGAEKAVGANTDLLEGGEFSPPKRPLKMTPALHLEYSPMVNLLVGFSGLIWLVWHFRIEGLSGINLDVVNLTLLMLGILLHKTPASFLKAAKESGGFIWGVVIQFPFYAGIFGMIRYSGLAEVMAHWFTTISSKSLYPLVVVWYSGILNYIVPSGGSKFTIEAPYILAAGKALGVSNPVTLIAYSWGDMITDIIQPFWALPLLGVAKLEFRDIMGYCLIYFVFYMAIVSLAFLFLPFVFSLV